MTDATRAAAAPLPARIAAWPGRVRPLRWRRHRIGLHAAALALLLLVLFPFAWMVQMALRPADAVLDDAVLFLPTLENFVALWQGHFPKSFLNSVLVSSLSTAASLALGVPAAYVLTRWRFRARRRVALWILATRMAPPIALTIPFFLAYRWVGLQDSVVGLALIYMTFNISIVVWFMQTFFAAIPRSLEEAAWIDGCGVWQAFRRVTLPLAAPGLAATAVFCFIFSWNDFFFALILTRTNAVTAPVAITNFLQYEGWEWGKIAAAGTLVMLPVLAFTLLVRKYLVCGLTAGGLKD
ncbi:carbohydrate ABC transporter membrane protein 2 (CUT1 family) [Azospirillum baldaniorum]|uniref:carbohydrate ABC transporter permease n=1 Tax=Azospirillum baldaniorum TaxID=1064539 RepID=UPI0011A35793|nr:carbohydrate ABC transporter permease [Azospirillum baldaniorum]TWA63629.1 carbohydrate ABC transporter membrane protein 2 (CUT1 family) [Azospirillum baldaniorum]